MSPLPPGQGTSSPNLARTPSSHPLPSDVLHHIISLTSAPEQATLMRTSKQLYQVTSRILYYRIPFDLDKKRTVFDGLPIGKWVQPSWSKKKRPLCRKRELFKLVRIIEVWPHHHRNPGTASIDFSKLEYTFPDLETIVYLSGADHPYDLYPALTTGNAKPRLVITHQKQYFTDHMIAGMVYRSKAILIESFTSAQPTEQGQRKPSWSRLICYPLDTASEDSVLPLTFHTIAWTNLFHEASLLSVHEIIGVERIFGKSPPCIKETEGRRIDTLDLEFRDRIMTLIDPIYLMNFPITRGKSKEAMKEAIGKWTFTSWETFLSKEKDPVVLAEANRYTR